MLQDNQGGSLNLVISLGLVIKVWLFKSEITLKIAKTQPHKGFSNYIIQRQYSLCITYKMKASKKFFQEFK